jgi:hypothetical protein
MAEPAQQGLPQDKIVDQPKPEVMDMKQGDAVAAVDALASADTSGFRDAIQSMLNNKVADYLDVKKLDVAQNFLKPKESEEEQPEVKASDDSKDKKPEIKDTEDKKEKEDVEV